MLRADEVEGALANQVACRRLPRPAPARTFSLSSTADRATVMTLRQNQRRTSVKTFPQPPHEVGAKHAPPAPRYAKAAGQTHGARLRNAPRGGPMKTGRGRPARNLRNQRTRRSEALHGRLKNRHALHMRGHRKDVRLEPAAEHAGQGLFRHPIGRDHGRASVKRASRSWKCNGVGIQVIMIDACARCSHGTTTALGPACRTKGLNPEGPGR